MECVLFCLRLCEETKEVFRPSLCQNVHCRSMVRRGGMLVGKMEDHVESYCQKVESYYCRKYCHCHQDYCVCQMYCHCEVLQ